MKLQQVTRSILSVTAVAWGIPLAQADDSQVQDTVHPKFPQLDANRDGFVSETVITAKVKAALLRERSLDSLDVSVETYKSRVLLSGFVRDDAQRRKAMQVASAVSGVTSVKDGLAVR